VIKAFGVRREGGPDEIAKDTLYNRYFRQDISAAGTEETLEAEGAIWKAEGISCQCA
jgi:hypothetical protein